jgi:SAM-dependent methyltransferase
MTEFSPSMQKPQDAPRQLPEKRGGLRNIISVQTNADYDKGVNIAHYHELAIKRGGREVAVNIGNIFKGILPFKKEQGEVPSILDVAAGTGLVAHHLKDLGYKVAATDKSQEALDFLHQKEPAVDVRQADMNVRLPFEENSFDGATTNWANRFITDPDTFIEEIKRVLKDGGKFVWPIDPGEILDWKLQAGLRKPTQAFSLVKKLKKAGFTTEMKKIPFYKALRRPFSIYPTRYIIATAHKEQTPPLDKN